MSPRPIGIENDTRQDGGQSPNNENTPPRT